MTGFVNCAKELDTSNPNAQPLSAMSKMTSTHKYRDYASDAGTDADASSEGTTTEENPSESEADAPSQSILQPKPIRL